MRRTTWALIGLGAIMTAAILGPVMYVESRDLPALNAGYFWMMIAPALAAGAVLLYQKRRGIDRPSSIATILIGIVITTYPFWGPSLDKSMEMPLDWIGTILGHYVPGALVVLAGVLQLMRGSKISVHASRNPS